MSLDSLRHLSLVCWVCCVAAQQIVPAFVQRPAWPYYTPWPKVIVDLDNDGVPEVVEALNLYSTTPGPTLTYRKVRGNGEWIMGPSFTSAAGGTITFHRALAAADVDGDGDQDVFVGRALGSVPWPDQIWLGDGMGGLTDASAQLPGTLTFLGAAEFVDVDGDGDQDLVLCDAYRLLLWINDGTGRFSDQTTHRLPGHDLYAPRRCIPIDADQDGDMDLFVVNGWGTFQPVVLYVNNGRGVFKPRDQGTIAGAVDAFRLDADADGWDDVFAIFGGSSMLYLSNPGQTLMAQAPQYIPTLPTGYRLTQVSTVIDFDGDGDLDIVGDLGALGWRLWENTGAGFVDVSNRLPTMGPSGANIVIDYDLDGDVDLFHGGGVVFNTPWSFYVSNTSREAVTITEPTRGGSYAVQFYAKANHMMAVGVATHALRQPMGAFGILFLDPPQTATAGLLFFTALGRQTVTMAVPNVPTLLGQFLCMQGLDVDLGTNTMHLTNSPFSSIQ